MSTKLVVTFKPSNEKKPGPPPPPPKKAGMPPPGHDPFFDEIERFAAADPRWRAAIEMAAGRLDADAKQTLGVCLAGIEAGPMPKLIPFDFGPDDADGIDRELLHMERKFLTVFGMLSAESIGLDPVELAAIQGIVTAIHRLLRIAKTRP